jgi:hypothetical protein
MLSPDLTRIDCVFLVEMREIAAMKTNVTLLILAALSTPATLVAQQAATSQPAQAQVPSAPCTTTSTTPNPSANHTTFKVPNKWKQQIQKTTGITVPDGSADPQQPASPKPVPCTPQAGATKPPVATQQAALKLPPDFTATLHCNPMTPSPKDSAGRPTTLTLPDPHDYAVPKPNDFEADSVVPDLAAHVACYLVKVDPKTSKVFVAQ